MKTISYYLDELQKLTETGTDYAVSKLLNTSTQRISKYRSGASFDDEMCVKVSDLLKIDLKEVIAAANYHREKNEKKKQFWLKTFENVKKPVAACLTLGLGYTLSLALTGHAAFNTVQHYILC